MIRTLVFLIVFLSAIGLLTYNLRRIISYLKTGKEDNRFSDIPLRILNVLKIGIGQSKILRDKVAGIVHVLIFWGFLLFLFAVLEALIQGFNSEFTFEFLGPLYSLITLTQDIFGLLVIASVLYALYRRYIIRVPRLQTNDAGRRDATVILVMILFVVLSMYGQNAAHVAKNMFLLSDYELRPVTALISPIFFGSNPVNGFFWFDVFWWGHILLIFAFMNFLPYSKHFHVITSLPNVFFSKTGENKYALRPINLEDESLEFYGAADTDHLTWKQMLDGFACTECGRCASVCPAANTGKVLSPRKIIVDIRHRTEEKAPVLIGNLENQEVLEKTLLHNYITPEELWSCTTCNACVYECPVTIEHVDAIVDMRRYLVLSESEFPTELNPVFKNLETNYSPWAFNWQDRAAWAEGLDVKTMADDKETEYLFWVGCAGSFDSRYQKVSRAFVDIMNKGGIDFRILGTEEKCNGDTARRLGNEYLAQTMMMENIETLNGYGVKKIVTGCPHCYNTLKNEYPQFGGNFEVIHHTEMINHLISDGKIKLKDAEKVTRVTYHDSCYLGRYNNIYDDPRKPLESIKNMDIVEMDRSKDKGFCCGAGGGRMFLEENQGTRINENRTEEALKLNPDTIASACPFCMTMLSDGVKAFDKNDSVKVKDIAEIVSEKLI